MSEGTAAHLGSIVQVTRPDETPVATMVFAMDAMVVVVVVVVLLVIVEREPTDEGAESAQQQSAEAMIIYVRPRSASYTVCICQ
jgi:hypothetical protein